MHLAWWSPACRPSFLHAHQSRVTLPASGPAAWCCRGEIFRTLHSAVEAFGLQDCWKAKPLLTGKEVTLPRMLMKLSWWGSGLSSGVHKSCMTHWHLKHMSSNLQVFLSEIHMRDDDVLGLVHMQVIAMLDIEGKLVGKVVEQISDWQLAHSDASAQQCKEWLEASKDSVLAQAKVALEEHAP